MKQASITRVNPVGVGSIERSQNSHAADGDIGAVVRVQMPEWRILKSHVRDYNVGGPHELYKPSPCVAQSFLFVLLPPPTTLSIYASIVTCHSNLRVLKRKYSKRG